MTTSLKQTSLFTEDKSTSSQADFPVNHIAKQEIDLVMKMTATSGRKCLEQYKKFNHVGSWGKMFTELLVGMTGWYSTKCRLTWKLKGTKYNRLYFQLVPLTHRIEETEYGLLPTPCVADTFGSPKRPNQITLKNGRYTRTSDNTGIQFGAKLNDVARLIPTPATRDYKGTNSLARLNCENGNVMSHANQLPNFIKIQTGSSSQLNPRFVAEMMGYPPNYTELPFLNGETNP
jgi:hypothetical protein